jgi:hypothetical protein
MNMTPNDPRTEASMCKSSRTQPGNSEAWIARIQALTVKETTSKARMQGHTNKESRETQPGGNGADWAETGLGQPTWVDWPSPVWARFGAPICSRCLSNCFLCLHWPPHQSNQSTDGIHKKTPAARWWRELDEFVARINIGGGKEARRGPQVVGLGVFPSFVTTIFVDDVLRSLHHPYVLQSL